MPLLWHTHTQEATVKNILLFFAAPFIGLAYIMATPFIGIVVLAALATRALAKQMHHAGVAQLARASAP